MLPYFTLLLICQLAGEVLVRLLHLPIPGPVVGMVLLFVGLLFRGKAAPEGLDRTVGAILPNLSLLFIPASVGIMVHLKTIANEWLPILVAVVVSTVVTLGATGLLMQGLNRWRNRHHEQ